MARKPRAKGVSGIYHVILRGINKQDVFLEPDDFKMMIYSLKETQISRREDGKEIDRNNCTYFAYCILHNHMHLLLQEGNMKVSEIMKRLQNRYVRLYNDRYERLGHLFQDRFVSEPVDDADYFYQLIRYIHRNPVKAMEAVRPEDYKYSSWREYIATLPQQMGSDPICHSRSEIRPVAMLCDTEAVARRFGDQNVVEWVNMDIDDKCLDMNDIAWKMSDATAWTILKEISETDSVGEFKQLSKEWQLEYLRHLQERGASLLQLSRLSSLSYAKLRSAFNKKSD